jgi:hypothetical protein
MQLLITPLAAFDLEKIGDYIAQDNPIRAARPLCGYNDARRGGISVPI